LRPVFLTSLTTMIGFLALNFAEAPPYWHLANMTAAGILAALLLSVTFLPAVLSYIPIRASEAGAARGVAFLDRMAELVLRHRGALVVLGLISLVGFGGLAARLESNDEFVEYFDDSIAFRPDTEFLMEHLTGIYQLELALDSGADGGVNDPHYLDTLARFTEWVRAQPEVAHVYGYADVMARLNMNMHEDDPRYRRVPRNRELASQYLLLYEMSLPYGRDLNDRLDTGRRASRLTVTVTDLSSREMRELTARIEGWLEHHAPASMRTRAIAPVVIFSHLSERNTQAMMRGNLVSLVLIALSLMLALRSPKLGLLSMIPNVIPIVFGYGLWALLFGQINIVSSIAGAICLGIIVDDTIHFLSKYQLARHDGRSPEDAVRVTMRGVAPAMIVTSLVLLFGFGVLTSSGFQMNSYLGLLTVFVVASALVADLLLLPALLVITDRVPSPVREPEPQTSVRPLTSSGEFPL
ncbi:MAG: RND family transporter, partial [Sandaracinaceae bacterium]